MKSDGKKAPVLHPDEREKMASMVEEARQLCGCTQCYGGFDIGARTLAAGVSAVDGRPYSCVASVVLRGMFRG